MDPNNMDEDQKDKNKRIILDRKRKIVVFVGAF